MPFAYTDGVCVIRLWRFSQVLQTERITRCKRTQLLEVNTSNITSLASQTFTSMIPVLRGGGIFPACPRSGASHLLSCCPESVLVIALKRHMEGTADNEAVRASLLMAFRFLLGRKSDAKGLALVNQDQMPSSGGVSLAALHPELWSPSPAGCSLRCLEALDLFFSEPRCCPRGPLRSRWSSCRRIVRLSILLWPDCPPLQ